MLLQNLASCWTGRSERSTITTLARGCGILPEAFEGLCRWQQSCSEDYIRGSRLLVEGAQEAIASAIWAGKGEADFLDGETCGIRSLGSRAARLEKLSWKFRFRACGTSTRAHVVRAVVTKFRE